MDSLRTSGFSGAEREFSRCDFLQVDRLRGVLGRVSVREDAFFRRKNTFQSVWPLDSIVFEQDTLCSQEWAFWS